MAEKSLDITLGDLEVEVMEVLWEQGPTDVKAAHAALSGRSDRRGLNTVQSTLERLNRKGLLAREKRSRAFVYSPVVSREQLVIETMSQMAARLGSADAAALMATFIDVAEKQDPDNLDRLQAMIDAHRARSDSEARSQSDE